MNRKEEYREKHLRGATNIYNMVARAKAEFNSLREEVERLTCKARELRVENISLKEEVRLQEMLKNQALRRVKELEKGNE